VYVDPPKDVGAKIRISVSSMWVRPWLWQRCSRDGNGQSPGGGGGASRQRLSPRRKPCFDVEAGSGEGRAPVQKVLRIDDGTQFVLCDEYFECVLQLGGLPMPPSKLMVCRTPEYVMIPGSCLLRIRQREGTVRDSEGSRWMCRSRRGRFARPRRTWRPRGMSCRRRM